jgi:hypothetical protein
MGRIAQARTRQNLKLVRSQQTMGTNAGMPRRMAGEASFIARPWYDRARL